MKEEKDSSTGGTLSQDSNQYQIGIDMGGTKILASVINSNGQILSRNKQATAPEQGSEAVIERISDQVDSVVKKAKIKKEQISAIGIGAPGPIDLDNGVVIFAPNLGWHNVPLKKSLEEKTGLPTHLDNDVNVGTLGEYAFGAGRGKKSVVCIFVGTGIGGGIIIDGKLFYGSSSTSGEIGHTIIKVGGPKCGCGNRGCLEALASRTAITKQLRKHILIDKESSLLTQINGNQLDTIKSGSIAKAFRQKDKVTVKVIKRATKYIGIGIASTVNFLNPEMIILGGGLIEALGNKTMDRIRHFATKYAIQHAMSGVEITTTQLGDDAGVIGAAVLAKQRSNK